MNEELFVIKINPSFMSSRGRLIDRIKCIIFATRVREFILVSIRLKHNLNILVKTAAVKN